MRPKKVLFVMNSLWGGGAEKVFQTVISHLDLSRYDVTVCSVNEAEVRAPYPLSGVRYTHIFGQRASGRVTRLMQRISNKIKLAVYYHSNPGTFRRLFMHGNYDIEIAFIEGYATRIVSGSTNRKTKKLAWVHIDLEKNPWTKIAYRNAEEETECYCRFNNVYAVSDDVCRTMRRLFPGIHDISVIHNPIDAEGIRRLSEDVIWERRKGLHLISIGRLEHQKGYDRLLPILKKLKDNGLIFTMTILGEGSLRTDLQQYINENGLNDIVKLPGFSDNPYPILRTADLFVCSSRTEGYSTAVTEALVLGIPVITTDCTGMEELLDGDNGGMIVENTDQALYNGLEKMLVNHDLLEIYRHKAIRRGKSFTLAPLLRKIEEVFE